MSSRQRRIEETLDAEFSLSHLDVADESSGHNVPRGAESHFKVTAVGSVFAEHSRIARHRLVNKVLQSEFDAGMHACALHLYSEDEWQQRQSQAPQSPACAGANETTADRG
ncbi:MAG: BolA family transcriptional regulator [Gammaproteobacteria bacterium]|nr:BolA family transcriptional regulator [Gammaproteobacteria bacterium]|tara:strand:- start:480 stop:812 length:333 start_codon:yes stop_codon:yes gene_type:complete